MPQVNLLEARRAGRHEGRHPRRGGRRRRGVPPARPLLPLIRLSEVLGRPAGTGDAASDDETDETHDGLTIAVLQAEDAGSAWSSTGC
nr:hypothetical protein [Angustibacter aerolatus]